MLYDKRWETKRAKPKRPDDWRGVLLRAADIIEEKGWCRSHFAHRGARCMLGAMNEADGHRPGITRLELLSPQRQLAEAMLIDRFRMTVPTWNDACCSTKDEVVAKLREVAGQP